MENEIFNYCRQKFKEENDAVKLLLKKGYTIIDLKGKIVEQNKN